MIEVSVGDPFCLHPLGNYSLMMEMKEVLKHWNSTPN
jgi:hypothetical protein